MCGPARSPGLQLGAGHVMVRCRGKGEVAGGGHRAKAMMVTAGYTQW